MAAVCGWRADTGVIEIVSDGHRRYTAGDNTQQLADDTHMAGTDVCTFDLVSGTYQQLPDGTTASSIIWKLRSGGDAHCGAFVTRSKYLGFAEGARDFRGFETRSTSRLTDSGKIGWVGTNSGGFAVGICEPIDK